jgi:putative nucleotidyltransferase with HDIG domain
MHEHLRVLFVDDEPNVLAAIRRMVHFKRPKWELACAESGLDALRLLETHPVDVVVSDVMMPGMDGGMLLKKIRRQWPSTLRIALSGQVTMEQVMKSIRNVHQYIGKPSDGDQLIERIELAMSCRDILLDEDMHRLVAEIDTLPVIPRVYQAIEAELSKAEPAMDRIADLIMRDTALAAKILSLVNSPFFGLSSRVQTVLHALTLLGLDIIRALVLSSKIFMTHEGMGLTDSSLKRLGEHSYRVTTIIKHLARITGKSRDEVVRCSVAAMLHDVGKLILATSFPDKFRNVVAMTKANRMYIHEAEREIFGSTHAELGAYLLALWGMNADVVRTVGRHHRHEDFDHSLTMLLHVANVMDHNCVRLPGEHEFRTLHPGLVDTPEHKELLADWCAQVKANWGEMENLAPFNPEGLFGDKIP